MKKPYSRFRSLLKTGLMLPLFITLSLFLGCNNISADVSEQQMINENLTIQLLSSDVIRVDGDKLTLSELDQFLETLNSVPETVYFQVSPNVSFGLVTDVQTLIRKHKLYKIHYSSTFSDLSFGPERCTVRACYFRTFPSLRNLIFKAIMETYVMEPAV